MFQFFANAVPSGVRLLPDIAYALDFITRMLMVFGFVFKSRYCVLSWFDWGGQILFYLNKLGLMSLLRPLRWECY